MDNMTVFNQEYEKFLATERKSLIGRANELVIVDESSLNRANDLLQMAKNHKKDLETKEKDLTKPLNDTKQKIIEAFKPARKEIDEVIRILSYDKIVPYQLALQKQAEEYKREEEARLKAEHEKVCSEGDLAGALSIENQLNAVSEIKTDTKIKSSQSTSTISMLWTFEIVDENAVPDIYKTTDEKKVKEAIKFGMRGIQGIRIFQKPSLGNRSKYSE